MMSRSSSSKGPPSGTEPPTEGQSCLAACAQRIAKRGRPSVAEAGLISDKILEASRQVLLEAGFDGFTCDRVARHAHIGKATIYSRFAGKHELMHALLLFAIERRRTFIMAQGMALPVREAFYIRAVEALSLLFSPDGKLIERLIDWLDQQEGDGATGYRAYAYRNALESIEEALHEAITEQTLRISNVSQAARYWLEGLLGHVRMVGSESEPDRAENERWARGYVDFFFAGLAAIQPPA